MGEVHRLDSVWGDFESERGASVGEGMARFYQSFEGGCRVLFFDQNVVGVKSGDRKYGDAALSQGIEERGQDSCERKRKWAFQLEACPRRFAFRILRSLLDGADD